MNKKSIYIALTATTCLAMLSCVTGQTCSAITQKNNRLGLEAKSPKHATVTIRIYSNIVTSNKSAIGADLPQSLTNNSITDFEHKSD